jgi:hypothetical protein
VTVGLIIFSKDRPYQLRVCLESLNHSLADNLNSVAVYIIYHPGNFGCSYDALRGSTDQFSNVFWCNELDDSFSARVRWSLADMRERGINSVCITVDDSVWINPIPLPEIESFLSDESILVVQCKLSPRVDYCHPADKFMKLPELEIISNNFIKFNFMDSELDWNYPFDFCGSFYILSTLESIIHSIEFNHPNNLEFNGNKYISTNSEMKKKLSIGLLHDPLLVVLTINRVQDVYTNRVYDEGEYSLDKLNSKLNENIFDFKLFQDLYFNSAHVPLPPLVTPRDAPPFCSWIIPVYNSSKYLRECINSILNQLNFNFNFNEIILIDDNSTDNSVSIIQEYIGRVPGTFKLVHCRRDRESSGLGFVLNRGFEKISVKSEFIFRLDSDDICLPNRFRDQIRYMNQFPRVSVCGGCFQYLNFKKIIKINSNNFQIKFNNLFYCDIPHPTACIRRTALPSLTPYSETEAAEDHWLWLNGGVEGEYGNVGSPVCELRLRPESLSTNRANQIRESSLRATQEWFTRRGFKDLTSSDIQCIVHSDPMRDSEQAVRVGSGIRFIREVFRRMIDSSLDTDLKSACRYYLETQLKSISAVLTSVTLGCDDPLSSIDVVDRFMTQIQ